MYKNLNVVIFYFKISCYVAEIVNKKKAYLGIV